ncbi:hypothetical protein ACFDR8_000907 [Arthrobacter sp. MP_2.3]
MGGEARLSNQKRAYQPWVFEVSERFHRKHFHTLLLLAGHLPMPRHA